MCIAFSFSLLHFLVKGQVGVKFIHMVLLNFSVSMFLFDETCDYFRIDVMVSKLLYKCLAWPIVFSK